MEKINREFLIKEIGSRLLYGVKAQVLGWDEEKGEIEVPLRVYSINTDGYVYFETNDYDVNYLAVDGCLLYLRPMSSMTEEEEIFYNIKYPYIKNYEQINWLNTHHFDYRGLIEKGLAIEVTEENNPYENFNS